MSLVVVTHELASIETIADTVTMIHKGLILADGPIDEVRKADHPMIRAFFDRLSDEGDPSADQRSILDALEEAQ